MARRRDEIKDLQRRIQALPPKDQAEVVKAVLTPAMQLQLTVEKMWSKPGKDDPRGIMRAILTARRELEREHAARRRRAELDPKRAP